MKWRLITLTSFLGILYSLLFFNLYNLQFNKRTFYLTRAEYQELAGNSLEPERGNIYFTDRNNNPIQAGMSKEFPVIYAVPTELIRDAEPLALSGERVRGAEILAGIINRPIEEIEAQLNKPNDQYELLVQKATAEQIQETGELGLRGIYNKIEILRYYPFERLASHILGFTTDKAGRYGTELYFDDELRGKAGELQDGDIKRPENGQDIFLSIDRNIQAQAEEILANLIKEKGAAGGTAIVQEPKNGKIIAMASFPNFDSNNYSKFEIKDFLNPAVQAIYEPGSIFKVITMAAGIDAGKITPETTYVDTGSVTFNGKTIKNWDLKAHGKQTMAGVIGESINTGAVFAERKTGHDVFFNYLKKFGFGELTGIDLPGEVGGNVNYLKKGRDIDFATASFGQGVAVTPIELVNAISAIANGGVLMNPSILKGREPEIIRRVISPETAKAVTEMMIASVRKNQIADIPNYSVAGKTGTAFIPKFGGRGYTDEVINTYAGFAPAHDPKFVILIKLNKPVGSPLAGLTVVPAFRELAQFILNYYNVPPDKLY